MIIVITGPTCLGKSETAVYLAKKMNAEIINGDAFQCYKQLNIGVAKPSDELLKEVNHHLYSFVDINHNYSIAEYQINLRAKINELLAKNKNIIIVGGSGLYIKSALYDYEFKENKTVDMSKYEKMDNRTLYDALKLIDPSEAEKIHFNNRKRLLRAIEIYLSEGKTKSTLIEEQKHKLIYDVKFFVKNLNREVLYENINKRVDVMMKNGLFEEVKYLYSQYNHNLNALEAIGYKELIDVIENKDTLEHSIEMIKQHTRNYAKRQMTYIRHQLPVNFYENNEDLWRILNE